MRIHGAELGLNAELIISIRNYLFSISFVVFTFYPPSPAHTAFSTFQVYAVFIASTKSGWARSDRRRRHGWSFTLFS